jgi:hypothetical protein
MPPPLWRSGWLPCIRRWARASWPCRHPVDSRGELEPGDTLLPEAELLEALQVSRPTLRQALRVLESESLIQLGRGARTGATSQAGGQSPSSQARRQGCQHLVHDFDIGGLYQVRTKSRFAGSLTIVLLTVASQCDQMHSLGNGVSA